MNRLSQHRKFEAAIHGMELKEQQHYATDDEFAAFFRNRAE